MARDGKIRLTQAQKDNKGKQWYKEMVDYHDSLSFHGTDSYDSYGRGEFYKQRVNYDLVNNKLDLRDFEYITQPWGEDVGDLPAQLANRDIISSKLKAVLGIEARRPFNWKVVAVNSEATTRKEQEEFSRIRQFVVSQIMGPIEQEAAMAAAQQIKGGVTPEQAAQIKEQVQQSIAAQTPQEVKKYMRRKHQDPAEILGSQILSYLTKKEDISSKFNKGFKHGCISGKEIYWIGIVNGEPTLRVVNPLYFDFDKSPDIDNIEDGEWAVAEYRMTPHEIISEFGNELSNKEIDEVYEMYERGRSETQFDFINDFDVYDQIRVLHVVWKDLRKIGLLTFLNEKGEKETRYVNEKYKLNKEAGDLSISWEWIPEEHEGYKIGSDIYVRMRPTPNQYKDLENIYDCKLSYVGSVYDNDNSEITSLVDRMRPYQYLYNIIWYRIELLIAQDKGKKALFNIAAIPRSQKIDLKKFEYFLDANSYGYLNPHEEGNRGNYEITNLVKEIDLSNTSDISAYMQLAEYIETQCGESVGVTKQLEGQIQEREAVSNVQRAVSLSTNILETTFKTHDRVKRNVLQRLIECAKVAYTINKPKKLAYVLDDMSMEMLSINQELLDNSTYGIFVTDSAKAYQTKEVLSQLAHAALQSQQINLATVVSVMQSDSIQEAEEILLQGEEESREQAMQAQRMKQDFELQKSREERDFKREEWQHDLKMLRIEEDLKLKREIQKQAILAMGFQSDQDVNENKVPDVLEAAKLALERKKLDIEELKAKKEIKSKKDQ